MDSKVIRAPSLKRGKNDGGLNERIKLKKVLGLTVCSNAALDVSPTTGVLAYPAGCTVVLFNSKKLSQSYLLNTSRKAITAIAYSQCGRYVATGECGQNPAIKVWELDPAAPNGCGGTVIAEFLGHKYAVSCIAFSPTGKYLVSVGSQHDMIVNVFDWKLNLKIASNKVSAKVVAVCFSQDGNYFVTVGNRHVKYWYLEGSRKYKEPIPLMGRSAILGELRNNDFCAVACGKGDMADSTYAITRSGQLVEFNSRRLLDKWVACLTTSANCLCISSQYILVGCAESMIRVFDAATLQYLTTLPRTHYLGTDVAQVVHFSHLAQVPAAAKFPDTIAMVFDEPRMRVSCVYNDHSLYIWDLRDIRRVGVSHSFLYHSACIWGVESVPYNFMAAQAAASGAPVTQPPPTLPVDCFLTCSSDDTIRFWALDEPGAEAASPQPPNDVYRKNIYSKDLLKVVYIDDELQFIKDVDNPILNMEKPSTYDGRNGVRCIKISPDRQHLATGDRSGNIRIYSLANLRLITTIEAHDSEVLCLEYTNEAIERRMLASASRDRLIHVFDVTNGYRILQTLDDHSSSITSVKFIGAGGAFQMVSCGADKSIIFRTFQGNQFLRGNNCSGKTTLYDMEIDSNAKHILTACQDRNIRIYGTQTAKHTRTFKGSHSDDGSLIKLSLDLSGIYVATSCTDKTLSVYDHYSAECMARMYGHSELVTGLKFTNDCKHLISASGDGCIFIWQVPHDMVVTMQARLSQQALRSGHAMVPQPTIPPRTPQPPTAAAQPLSPSPDVAFGSPPPNFGHETMPPSGYRFSDVGQLPQWAKKKPEAEPPEVSPPASVLSSSPGQGPVPFGGQSLKPRGRWAQKATFEPDALDLRGVSGSPSGLGTSGAGLAAQTTTIGQTSDYNSASSKDVYLHHGHNHNTYLSEDSSIDSGMENRRELMFVSKGDKKPATGQLQFESNNEHDGDIEDISDGERTSSEHGGLFYPAAVGPGTPTEFKVNAMNEDELRKSVRRQKFERQGLQLSAAPAASVLSSGGGTGTSDDEDEGSTPSGDNAERSLASTLGGSSESIPAAVAASATAAAASSSFMQAAIDGASSLSDRGDRSRRSISAKHNSSDSKSFSKSFSNSKKDELMKVINEAKQKLENGSRIDKLSSINEVGYRSTLRSSQSISDLSHAANMERAAGLRGQRNSGNPKSLLSHHALSDDDPSSSIRRACSLSDLSMGKAGAKSTAGTPLSATNNNLASNSGKPTPATRSAAANGSAQTNGRNPPKRTVSTTASTSASGSGMGSRSISVGTLNQPLSDSDPEAIANRVGLQRPTISSLNKNNGNSTPSSSRPYTNNTKSAAGLISRRRGMSSAYSSVNLTTAGQDDSSSEEAQSIPAVPNGKPAVPPRPRSISIEHKRNGLALNLGANNNHNTSAAGSPLRSAVRPTATAGDEAGLDVDGSDLSAQLCSNIISQLMATTNSVMQLHQRLKHGDETATAAVGGSRHKNQMLKELENAVIMTQSMLTTVTASRDSGGGTTSTGPHVTFFDSNRHSEQNGNGGSQQQQQQQQQSMLDKCTDMLHKVQKQHSTSAHNS